jgi:hypothetical protein
VLLLLLFYLYNIITINKAEEIMPPMEEAGIVIETEPEIIPEAETAEEGMPLLETGVIETVITGEELMTGLIA